MAIRFGKIAEKPRATWQPPKNTLQLHLSAASLLSIFIYSIRLFPVSFLHGVTKEKVTRIFFNA